MVHDGVLRNECGCRISILFASSGVLMYDDKGSFILAAVKKHQQNRQQSVT
ncbi:hypothetical protein [Bacillus vallismortis]|uniref:hypothetical protein n=1 Tax=Bacillus vallismortis TaxID=72361 RepID=UPI00227FA5AA|nr:hypothetical protein [Bacillus vallismortis]MCY7917211.1 hypothetical protein [Bacillus vallismortis]MCY8308351.1 hypothetical protein [Bacillus vallismortis]